MRRLDSGAAAARRTAARREAAGDRRSLAQAAAETEAARRRATAVRVAAVAAAHRRSPARRAAETRSPAATAAHRAHRAAEGAAVAQRELIARRKATLAARRKPAAVAVRRRAMAHRRETEAKEAPLHSHHLAPGRPERRTRRSRSSSRRARGGVPPSNSFAPAESHAPARSALLRLRADLAGHTPWPEAPEVHLGADRTHFHLRSSPPEEEAAAPQTATEPAGGRQTARREEEAVQRPRGRSHTSCKTCRWAGWASRTSGRRSSSDRGFPRADSFAHAGSITEKMRRLTSFKPQRERVEPAATSAARITSRTGTWCAFAAATQASNSGLT